MFNKVISVLDAFLTHTSIMILVLVEHIFYHKTIPLLNVYTARILSL